MRSVPIYVGMEDEPRSGILIHTAVPDAEGTLGGLVSLAWFDIASHAGGADMNVGGGATVDPRDRYVPVEDSDTPDCRGKRQRDKWQDHQRSRFRSSAALVRG